MDYKYSTVIQWSDEDEKYIVSLPEFGFYANTHGASYVEILKNGREVLELLIEDYQATNKILPNPSNLKLTVEV